VQGSGRGLILNTGSHLPEGTEENMNTSCNRWCSKYRTGAT